MLGPSEESVQGTKTKSCPSHINQAKCCFCEKSTTEPTECASQTQAIKTYQTNVEISNTLVRCWRQNSLQTQTTLQEQEEYFNAEKQNIKGERPSVPCDYSCCLLEFTTKDENLSLKCYTLKTTRNNLIIPVGRQFVPLAQDIRPSYSQCCCSSAANLSERGCIFFKGKIYLGERGKSEKGDGKHGHIRFATFSYQFKCKEAKTWLKQCQKHKEEI